MERRAKPGSATPILHPQEHRRRRAWELYQQGWTQRQIAASLGVSQGAVSQWLKRGRAGGVEALRRRPAPGAMPRLTMEQRAYLAELLEQGPAAYGFPGCGWSRSSVAGLIKQAFGITYSDSQAGRIWSALREEADRS